MSKCTCTPEETTGWTTVKCCNICGLPIQAEVWDFETKNDGMKPTDEQISIEAGRRFVSIKSQIIWIKGAKWCSEQMQDSIITLKDEYQKRYNRNKVLLNGYAEYIDVDFENKSAIESEQEIYAGFIKKLSDILLPQSPASANPKTDKP